MLVYDKQVTNKQLEEKLVNDHVIVLDVREKNEYDLAHIPEAVLVPLGELDKHFHKFMPNDEIYVICRTGIRSNQACHILKDKGFHYVYNVVPGMMDWSGPTVSNYN